MRLKAFKWRSWNIISIKFDLEKYQGMPMATKTQKGIIIVTMILVKKVSSLIALHDNK